MLPHSNLWDAQACICLTIVFPFGKTLQQQQLLRATCQGLAAQAPMQGLCSKQVAAEEELFCHLCHPLMLGHHSIFQGLEDKGISLAWERATAASPEAVPSSSPAMKGDPERTKGSSAAIWQSVTWGHEHGALPAPLDSLLPPVHL